MAHATFHFPRGFLWGTATSSHQVEGNNRNNNWWAWEHEPGRILHGHRSGLACDWWGGRWRGDLDRAAEAGQNAHRLSIEWSRVQPTPDQWDESALDYYREILQGVRERGLTPVVTLHHFTDPLWLAEMGGWENEAVVERFATYARKVLEALKEYVSIWCTINEPNVLAALGYVLGLFPPGKRDLGAAFGVMANLARAHAAAYHVIHEVDGRARAGMAVSYIDMQPARRWSPLDRLIAGTLSRLYNDFFPRAARDGVLRYPHRRVRMGDARRTQDFLGVNYYTRELVAFDPRKSDQLFARRIFPPDAPRSDTGHMAHVPEGMFEALRWAQAYDVPIIVTENGVEDADDHLRPRYIIEHVHQMWRAVNFNWPIEGYFHWTLVDNFEWERGWTQRFGLWELDRESQARRKRPSADLYAAICETNSLSSDVVQTYVPELMESMFPG